MIVNIGIYSGTFDPVHQGHVAFAAAAAQQCQLDKVVFLPEQLPRGKQIVTSITHRRALLKIALRRHDIMCVGDVPSKQFTVATTIPEITAQFPAAHLWLLLGSDILLGSFQDWPDLAELLRQVSIIVGLRGDNMPRQITRHMELIESKLGYKPQYAVVETLHANAASSLIRNAINSHDFDAEALTYIRQHGLYI